MRSTSYSRKAEMQIVEYATSNERVHEMGLLIAGKIIEGHQGT